MLATDKHYNETIALTPRDWLFWKDEDFNDWRRKHDFPRVVEFLFDTLPFFSLWLSEQVGLTEKDLLFHGPARFIRFYGKSVTYVEHDVGMSIFREAPVAKVIRYEFLEQNNAEKIDGMRAIRQVRFVSYIDWAFSRKKWAFPNKIKDVRDIANFFTPSGRTSETSDYLNSNSNIQFNIPLFMPSFTLESLRSKPITEAPPRLELLKLGGGGIEITGGLVGEKNLEFTNIDNLSLISPIITSFQTIAFSTLRNFKVVGLIHAVKFYQCSVEISVRKGGFSSCDFEYGDHEIELIHSKFNRSSIRSRLLNLKLPDTEILDCHFEYSELFSFSSKEKRAFHKSAKMIFSHQGYPDWAGEHFLIEKKSERRHMLEVFSSIKPFTGMARRLHALYRFLWMCLQELYWGYGERPFNIILSSVAIVLIVSLLGYFEQGSSTYGDAVRSGSTPFPRTVIKRL